LDELTRHFNRYNDVELAFTFAEKVSGFDSEDLRLEMKKVLEKVDNHEIDEIWVNDFARLSRDAVNLQNIVKHCADLGVNIYFRSNDLYSLDINKQLNLTTRFIISNLSIFAEMDAKNFKEKGIQGKRTKVSQNQYIGGLLPLAYTSLEGKDKKIIIDEKRKQLVEYIFDSYVKKKYH
jgi:DNA invertase Pin-like site-specific DNA recombinase